jgi:hypothetical protein
METLATANDVRLEAGFVGNANVLNETIEKYVVMAHSIVVSNIASRYDTTLLTGANFTDSQAFEYLKTAEILIAAGLLLQKEFGDEALNTDKEGTKRIEQGKNMLLQMHDKSTPVYLIGNDGVEFSRKSVSTAGTIAAPAFKSGEAFFSVGMRI